MSVWFSIQILFSLLGERESQEFRVQELDKINIHMILSKIFQYRHGIRGKESSRSYRCETSDQEKPL